MLTANQLTYEIDGKTLVKDVSLNFSPGRLNFILGPNGAGKSTLLKLLSAPSGNKKGTVTYDGKDLNHMNHQELAKIRAVLSQNIDLAFPLSVEELVMMGRYPHFTGKPGVKDIEAIESAMDFFDVLSFRNRNYLTLSGGEKQRVQFARILAQIWEPVPGSSRYLFLDEPLTHLDIYYQLEFLRKIRELAAKPDLTIIGILHDLNLTAAFGDHLVLLREGRVLARGNKTTVLTIENIKKAFRVSAQVIQNDDCMSIQF